MLPLEKYSLPITDFENDILKKTILNHKKRYSVTRPIKWESYTKAVSNIKFVSGRDWGQKFPLLTFETLFYNYVYDKIDDYVQRNLPDRIGDPYHTDNCWYMIYEGDARQVAHNHIHTMEVETADYLCSGIYYPEMPKDGYRVLNTYTDNPKEGGKLQERFFPKEKELFLFDCGLWHEPVQKETKSRSIAVAFDVHFIS